MKRFLSVLLCLCMMATMMPAYALEANTKAPEWIKILGIELTDGDYLASNSATEASENYADGDEYVALYKDGVLILNGINIVNEDSSADDDRCVYWDYDASGNDDLVIELVAGTTNTMVDENVAAINGSSGYGNGPSLIIQGDGVLNVTGATYGIWVWQDVIIQNGAVVNIVGGTKSGISNNTSTGSIVVKQGTNVTVTGNEYGVSSDNDATGNFIVQGGNLTVAGNTAAVNKVSSDFAGNTVYVGNDVTGADEALWDGVTDITTYKYIRITGFSDTVLTYNVGKNVTTNGSFEVDFEESMAGETITINATPDTDYEVDNVTVTDEEDGDVEVTGTGNVRQFTMPEKDVVVDVTFKKLPANYTALDNAITEAGNVDRTKYTTDSLDILDAAIEVAEGLGRNLTKDDQSTIDDAKNAILAAITGLVELADFSAYKDAIDAVNALERSNYTTGSLNALDAVVAANAIDKTNEADQTKVDNAASAITNAIANLVETRVVKFSAVAVDDDDDAQDYMRANKIYLVFDEPIDNSIDILNKFQINPDDYWGYKDISNFASAGTWIDNTIYCITLKSAPTYPLMNNSKIKFVSDESVKAVAGHVLKDYEATVVGNLEEAEENVTANAMTATIVDKHPEPDMVAGDEIVLVFNAPVYKFLDELELENNMSADVVTGTYNTVYKITLKDADRDYVQPGGTIKYGDIEATIVGSYGKTVVPEVVRALVEDADGTAKTAGDKINVFFSAPTNKTAGTIENAFTGVLAGATGVWLDNQTLVITLSNTTIKITDRILLSGLGIKDFYGTADVDVNGESNLGYALEGSFGVAIEPKLLTVTAISKSGAGTASKGDEIHLSFNVKMREDALDLIDDFTFTSGDFGSTGAKVEWATGEEYVNYSTIIITLGNEPHVVPGETKISINKELREETGNKACDRIELQNRKVTGTFGATIAPELLSASIVKTKPVVGPQNGDQIVLLFNVPTNGKNIDNLLKIGSKSLGTGYEGHWNNDFTVYTIELGSTPTVAGGDTIEFDNDGTLKDRNNQKQAKSNSVAIAGSFGEEATPVGISPSKVTATIVKATTVAGPQAEDKIVFAFNVATNGSEGLMLDFFNAQGNKFGNGLRGSWNDSKTIYTLYLGTGATVADGETITFTSQAGIQDKDSINNPVTLACTLIGSFGIEITPVTVVPSLLDAVIIKGGNTVGATKGDKIQFIFNMAINDANLYAEFGGVNVFGTESNGAKDNNIYTITIGDNANIPAIFSITAAAGLKDAAEFSESAVIPNIVLTGSFGDEIKPVTAAPTLFKAVIVKATDTVGPQAGDKIQLVFNMAINDADLFTALGGEAVFGAGAYGNADNNVYTITLGTGITTIPTSFSINSDAGLKDASGYSANAVIPNFSLVGSFGIVVNPVATKPALKNAVIIKDSGMLGIHAGDKIVLTFNVATNRYDLLNTIDFGGRDGETLGTGARGHWISDIEYEIILGSGAKISEDVEQSAIMKFIHHGNLKDKLEITVADEIIVDEFVGSFGVAPELKLEKAIIVKGENNTAAKAQEGDKIVLSFSSKTKTTIIDDVEYGIDIASKLDENLYGDGVDGEWSNDFTVYTVVLGADPAITDTASISIPTSAGLAGFDGGVFASNSVTLEGSFGKVNTPSVISAVAYSDVDNDYIDITFNIDTNTYIENQAQGNYIFTSDTRAILGNYSINWNKGPNVLTIILGNNHTFVKTSKIEFTNGIVKDADELGVLAANTKVANVNGELRKPYVTSVVANYDEVTGVETLTVTFSSKTNKPENIDLSAQYSSLGRGATAAWSDTKTLVITLGEGRTISVNGTGGIILNGLGITNGFDTNEVVGQYSITDGTLREYDLEIADARVNRKTIDNNVTVDLLTVTFTAATNMYGKTLNTEFDINELLAESVADSKVVPTKTFGTGATAKWESASKLVIKLGEGSTFRNANDTKLAANSKIMFKDLKFANGLGSIKAESKDITGSFDGREVRLNALAVVTANEYTTATVKVDKQEFEYADDAIVTFVIWDSTKNTVTDMNAVKVNMAAVDTIEVSSKFATKDYSKVEVYVTDEYINDIDENTTFGVLANTVTANKAQ